MKGITTIEAYLDYLKSVEAKPRLWHIVEQVQEEFAKDPKARWTYSGQAEDAVSADAYGILLYDGSWGYYERLRLRRKERAARAAETRRRRLNSGSRATDSQRSKLYKAEMCIRHKGRKFESIAEVQMYLDKILASAWFKRRYSMKAVRVQSGRGCYASGNSPTITLAKWGLNEAVVLHELSHLVTDRTYGTYGIQAHGREFAKTFLELVRHKMGDEIWRTLKDSFAKARVKHTLPRKPMSEEQRAAATERLVLARSVRTGGST